MAKEINVNALQANLKMIDKKGELAFEQSKAAGTLTPEQEKFSALISDEAFLEKFFAADSAAEVVALFSENGLNLSEKEVNLFGKYISDICKKLIENGGELSEEELEHIAGGDIFDYMNSGSDGEQIGAALGAVTGMSAGIFGMGIGGTKLGAAIGTCICPGVGSAVGAAIGLSVGMVSGTVIGLFGGTGAGKGIVKGAKKAGKWIKSWF